MNRTMAGVLTLVLGLALPALAAATEMVTDRYSGRDMLVYAPAALPPHGERALVIVLHGGLGNAKRIAFNQAEGGMNLDAAADANGFVVAYLNGTPVTLRMGPEFLGWNAGGGCCGQSAAKNVDDVNYIKGAVAYLAQKYGIDPRRVYGIGHSNGAMMTQRMICETDVYAAGIAISGPLNIDGNTCQAAHGKRVLAVHGANDENVPIAGGRGTKGFSDTVYKSEASSQAVMTGSGSTYDLLVLPGAEHMLNTIGKALAATQHQSIAEKAVSYFGLAKR